MKKNLTEAVYASGNLYPDQEYVLKAQSNGVVMDQLVKEGDAVDSGQVLFLLEPEVSSGQLQAAQSAFKLAQRNAAPNSGIMAELQARLLAAKERYTHDSANYKRFKALLAKEATTQQKVDQASLAYQVSRQDYLAAKENIQTTRNRLQVELEQAKSNLTSAGKSSEYTSPQAHSKARVYEIYKEKGALVGMGEPLALLGDHQELVVQMKVDELDILKVRIGQEVLVRFDIHQDKVYKAKVTKIYPKLNKMDQSFRVDARFESEQPQDFYGLTLEANIIIQTKKNIMVIPRNLLLEGDSVMVDRNGNAEKVSVKSGIRDWDHVEIHSGLDWEDQLITQ